MKTDIILSHHAQVRAQQRAVDPRVVELLLEFGASEYSHGSRIFHFRSHKAQRRLRRNLPASEWKGVERKLNCYAVVSGEGSLITVGRRYKPVRPS